MDARGMFSQTFHFGYPVVYDLHRFLISVARVVVTDDCKGGTALDPITWSAGSLPKKRQHMAGRKGRGWKSVPS